MAGCIPCFIIPLLLFIFHKYIQPYLLKIWNPWEKLEVPKESFNCYECKRGDKTCANNTDGNESVNTDSAIKDSVDGKIKVN